MTEADTRVEKVVTEMIKNAFPEDMIVGEEDYASCPLGAQGEHFPKGSIWCVGKFHPMYTFWSIMFALFFSVLSHSESYLKMNLFLGID